MRHMRRLLVLRQRRAETRRAPRALPSEHRTPPGPLRRGRREVQLLAPSMRPTLMKTRRNKARSTYWDVHLVFDSKVEFNADRRLRDAGEIEQGKPPFVANCV